MAYCIVCVFMTYCVFACLQTKLESGTTSTAALFAELLVFVSCYGIIAVLPHSRRDMTRHTKNTETHTYADIHNTLTHTTHTEDERRREGV